MHEERLLRLAQALEDEIPEKMFDFGEVMRVGDYWPDVALAKGGGCGTVGCAIGLGPLTFPELKWKASNGIYLVHHEKCSTGAINGFSCQCLLDFFDLDSVDFYHLFAAHMAYGRDGYDEWSKDDVARHIRKFVECGGADGCNPFAQVAQ